MKYTKKLMLLTLIISSAMMLPLSSFAQSIPQTTVSTARYEYRLLPGEGYADCQDKPAGCDHRE